MKRKNILNLLKLEMEDNLPTDILNSVKKIEVEKDLTPVYDEINSCGTIVLKTNFKLIAGIMGFAIIMFTMLLLFLPILNKALNKQAIIVSKLGIDINPSIDLMLDQNNDVVLCLAKNKHAEILLNGENYVGKSAEEVTERIITLAAKAGYFSTSYSNEIKNAVLITAVSENEKTQANLISCVKNKINNFYLNHQIYGIVLTDFASKQELVDLIGTLDYDLTEQQKQDLTTLSVKQLNQILNENYTKLKRRFRSDFVIEELNNCIQPLAMQYEMERGNIDCKLKDIETELTNFEESWKKDTELCKSKIQLWENEIQELNEEIKISTDPVILAKLKLEKETKEMFLLSEQKELENREIGSEIFNAAKNKLLTTINEYKRQLENKQKEYLVKVDTELGKAKENFNALDELFKSRKQRIIKTGTEILNNHLNNLQNYNDFYNNFENWQKSEGVVVESSSIKENWKTFKHNWEQNFVSYVQF